MIAPEHPLASGPVVRLSDLANEIFLQIRLYDADSGRIWTQEICRKAGFTPVSAPPPWTSITSPAWSPPAKASPSSPKLSLRVPTPGCANLPIAEKNLCLELLAVSDPHFHSDLVERFLEIVATEAATVEQRLQETAVPPPKSSAAKRKVKPATPGTKVAKRSPVQRSSRSAAR